MSERNAVSTHPSERTRERVQQAISERGPITAAELGEAFDLTPAAMRRHLEALVADGVIEEHDAVTSGAKKRGRPARAYVLTQAGHGMMPEGYNTLAHQALRHLAAIGGEEAIDKVAQERADDIARAVAPALDSVGDDVDARAEALARALTRQGFSASSRPVATGTPLAGMQLCQGHCPVQHIARDHPQFCEAEAEAFSDLLGVHVQRLASLAHGDHVCTTFVPIGAPTRPLDDQDITPHTKEQR